jgi:hypothetical protein
MDRRSGTGCDAVASIFGFTISSRNNSPHVRLRIRGGSFSGFARELSGAGERQKAAAAYCETVNPFDYGECRMWRKELPSRAKIKELHRAWFEQGIPLAWSWSNRSESHQRLSFLTRSSPARSALTAGRAW